MTDNRKVIFSGIQPSGDITLGNYLGAIRNWAMLQDEYFCIYSVVNMHAITVRQNPAELRRRTLELYARLIACGVDPERNLLFIQSHVPQHAELAWILGCYTQFGELSRMTQFKDKASRYSDNITAGLFTYPALMAADILLYRADLVPVGADQKQHLELSRDVAVRFNGAHGETFTLPEPYIPKVGARIMSLQDPARKMDKSDENENAVIRLKDTGDVIIRKFKRAVTDSEAEVRYDTEKKPGISNLMSIYSLASGKDFPEIESEFQGKGYGAFKEAVGEAVEHMLRPVRERTEYLLKNKDHLESVYRSAAEAAGAIAERTMRKVRKRIGFV